MTTEEYYFALLAIVHSVTDIQVTGPLSIVDDDIRIIICKECCEKKGVYSRGSVYYIALGKKSQVIHYPVGEDDPEIMDEHEVSVFKTERFLIPFLQGVYNKIELPSSEWCEGLDQLRKDLGLDNSINRKSARS